MGEVSVPPQLLTWCEVSRAALESNVETFRRQLAPGALLGIVVKSNAYGHGLVTCARVFLSAGVDWLIVNTVGEAQQLRQAGLEGPIYVCGPVAPWQAAAVLGADARVALYDLALAQALNQAAQKLGRLARVHLKVETGTHRQGLPEAQLIALGAQVASLDHVEIEGLTTHFADIEDTTDHAFARKQLEAFESAVAALQHAGIRIPMHHAANSAATLLWPEAHQSLTRVGVAAYGLWPSRETFATTLQRHAGGSAMPQLRPALSWRARLAQIKKVPMGGYVSYGRSYRASREMRLAVLPIGYFEGYDRRLSNLGHVLVAGQRAPVCGRVCMNMMMVDVTDIPAAKPGSVATLLGVDGDEQITAEQLASWMGTIHYEVVSRVHQSIPRFLVDGDLM